MIDPAGRVWRVGHVDGPLDFVPWALQSWRHRFDDVDRRYRTLYCAAQRATALREVLQDFRADAVLIAEYRELFGVDPPGGAVPRDWRERSRLAPARIAPPDARLADADDVALRQRFEYDEAPLLAEHGLSHFDVSAVRSRQRAVTQRFSAWLYDEGHAGIAFRSNVDGEPCGALFEERAALVVDGPVEPIDDLDELPVVLDELRLTLA